MNSADPAAGGSGSYGAEAGSTACGEPRRMTADREDLPTYAEAAAAAFRSPRQAWSPGLLLPAWILSLILWAFWEKVLPSGDLLRAGGAGISILVLWAFSCPIIAMASWHFGRGEKMAWSDSLAILRSRWVAVFGGPLFAPTAALVIAAPLLGGAFALGTIPWAGKFLAAAWIILPGMVLALLAAGILLLGIPALPLILAAGCLEGPFLFDAASRGMSYLRSRPLKFLALLASGILGSAMGAAVFALFAATVAGLVILAAHLAVPAAAPAQWLPALLQDLRLALGASDIGWPILPGILSRAGPEGAAGGGAAVLAAVLAGRGLTAFAAVSLLCLCARIYLLLRWEIDGEPPGSQLKAREGFGWRECK